MSNLDISSILSSLSGDDIENLKKVATNLLSGQENNDDEKSESASSDAQVPALSKAPLPDMAKLASLAPILTEFTKKDERADFLVSLKPFLSDERKPKADEAAKLVRLLNLIPHLRERGIL